MTQFVNPALYPIRLLGTDVDVADERRCVLGELPLWDHRANVLYWVDGIGEAVHARDFASGATRTWPMPEEVGAIALRTTPNSLLVGLRSSISILDLESGSLSPVAQPEIDRPLNRFSDGKLDRRGRFWTGTLQAAKYQARGRLWRLDPDYSIHQMLDGATCPNASVGVPTIASCTTPTPSAHRSTPSTSTWMTGRSTTAACSPTFHSEGYLRRRHGRLGGIPLGGSHGWMVHHPLRPERARGAHHAPARASTDGVLLRGPKLDTLFVTTATRRMSEKEIRQQPLGGKLLALHPGVTGLPEPLFPG